MQNILINMCEKFYNDRLRHDRFLGNWKSDKKKKNNNKNIALGYPFPCLKTTKHSMPMQDTWLDLGPIGLFK